MARIKGVEIPNDKKIEIALTYIYGIGNSLSKEILTNVNIDLNKKAKDLTEEELVAIRDEMSKHSVEGDLRREVNMNVKTKMEIGSYQGLRH
ncbi:MAG: 30S ribosomal protein S13, partial [Bacilli bacterium]